MTRCKEWIQQNNLNQAYRAAEEALKANPQDKQSLYEMFHVLTLLFKRESEKKLTGVLEKIMEKIIGLNYKPDDFQLQCWFWTFAAALKKIGNQTTARVLIEQMETFLKKTAPIKPSSAYSALLYAVTRIQTKPIIPFVLAWDIDNLRDADYIPIITEKYTLRPLAAALQKPLVNELEEGIEKQQEPGYKELREKINTLLIRCLSDEENFPFSRYYLARLHREQEEPETWLTCYKPFLTRHLHDFWAWDTAAELFHPASDQCLIFRCRALLCKAKPEFVIGVRRKLIPQLLARQQKEQAASELDAIITERNRNGWALPDDLVAMTASTWYQQSKKSALNAGFYESWGQNAEELIGGMQELIGIITAVDAKNLYWVSEQETYGKVVKTKELEVRGAGERIKIRYMGELRARSKIKGIKVEPTEAWPAAAVYQTFKGQVALVVNGYRIGKIFVAGEIGEKYRLIAGQKAAGLRVRVYNPKQQRTIWRIIKITTGV